MNELITVFVIAPSCLLREGLIALLAEQRDIIVIGASAGDVLTVEQIRLIRPSITLIDMETADCNPVMLIRTLQRQVPDVKTVVLGLPDISDWMKLHLETGAAGYAGKDAPFDALLATLHAVHDTTSSYSPQAVQSDYSHAGRRFFPAP
jgi:DNA-binding NarL/FixJ family response regulator